MSATLQHHLRLILAALCFVWVGLLAGISFLEAPVKFQAPSLTLEVGLDVGRQVFGAFDYVQRALTVLVLFGLVLLRQRLNIGITVALGLVLFLQLWQTLFLLPLLDARVELILNGEVPPPAAWHIVYIVIEASKIILLAGSGYALLVGRARNGIANAR